MRTVLFHRDFQGFKGGHLKVWHYYNHVRACPGHAARISFSQRTVWDESNPWLPLRHEVVDSWNSIRPDVSFLAGLDWLIVPTEQRERSPIPIINLIQGVRHARPGDPRYPFLKHKAIRICVSDAVAEAVAESRQVNGPVFVIPNAIDTGDLPAPAGEAGKSCDLLIAALNQPELGRQIENALSKAGWRIESLTTYLPRADFLGRINQARVTVFLPDPVEGFYLPALEGMALGTLVVCPDCIGNRSFCLLGRNCYRPEYEREAIVSAAEAALKLPADEARLMLHNARVTVAEHDLSRERNAFWEILQNVSELW